MLIPVYTTQFKRDVKRVSQRGYDMDKLKQVIDLLLSEERLIPANYKDHALKGRWKPHRELHIEPDWLLIYSIDGKECFFARTGTHADLFSL
ncbi:type II toxin-antitoxin system YafQ family toxin [Desulfovibrio piger]|mgnify:FL=1|jgi:mRNA interferase YafQ|uniref:type II toxin-antitoxin system YafQ family toxin n=1 Tax=Desulfovibrio piger TaxID=901 RepID=UPI0026EA70FF|nr:type II toxin-antitoxin system YafQ family toxin [Desulfovibrio piger]